MHNPQRITGVEGASKHEWLPGHKCYGCGIRGEGYAARLDPRSNIVSVCSKCLATGRVVNDPRTCNAVRLADPVR